MLFRNLTIAFLLFAISGSAQYSFLLHKKDWELVSLLRETRNQILQLDSSKALRVIDDISATSKSVDDEALKLEAEYMRAEYYLQGKQKNVKAGLSMIQPMLQEARAHKLRHAEARILANFASFVCFVDDDVPKCLRTYLRALDIASRFPDEEFPEMLSLLHHIAGLYYRFGENEKAREYALKAIREKDYQVPEYLCHRHSALNTLGLTYRAEHKYDSALYYFNYALHSLDTTHGNVWRGETWKAITKGNIGITYLMQGKFSAAKPLLEEDVRYCIAGEEYDNAVNSLLKLSQIALEEGDTATAFAQLTEARRMCTIARDTFTPLQDIYRSLYYTAIWKKDKSLALHYADSLMSVRDSLIKKEKSVMVIREALLDQELEQHKEQEIVEARNKRQVLFRNLAIAVLAIGGGTLVYLLNKRRLHHKAQKKVFAQRNALTGKALEAARAELAAFTQAISEKNALIEKMTAALNREEGNDDGTDSPVMAKSNTELLLQLQQSILLTDEQWVDFQHLFEKAHPGYIIRLHKKLGNLSPAETRYILLLKLRLSQKEMAAMLGISPSSIRIYRYRLRKKLQLGEDSNLEELAFSI